MHCNTKHVHGTGINWEERERTTITLIQFQSSTHHWKNEKHVTTPNYIFQGTVLLICSGYQYQLLCRLPMYMHCSNKLYRNDMAMETHHPTFQHLLNLTQCLHFIWIKLINRTNTRSQIILTDLTFQHTKKRELIV